jgi:hypothetical protein
MCLLPIDSFIGALRAFKAINIRVVAHDHRRQLMGRPRLFLYALRRFTPRCPNQWRRVVQLAAAGGRFRGQRALHRNARMRVDHIGF